MFRLVFLFSLSAVAAPALAATDAVPAPATKPVDPSQRMVCQTEQVTGSLGRRRTCKTVAQWQQADRASTNTLKAGDRAQVCAGPSCAGGQ